MLHLVLRAHFSGGMLDGLPGASVTMTQASTPKVDLYTTRSTSNGSPNDFSAVGTAQEEWDIRGNVPKLITLELCLRHEAPRLRTSRIRIIHPLRGLLSSPWRGVHGNQSMNGVRVRLRGAEPRS